MITPAELTRKLERLYPRYLEAWISGEQFFPRAIPFNRELPTSLAKASADVQQLRKHSKENLGHGYSIEWESRNSRVFGRNQFPKSIYVESEADLLLSVGKQQEFQQFSKAVSKIRHHFPALNEWIRSNRQELVVNASSIDGLLEVVDYLHKNPRPNLFARELPLLVDTKFIENHRGILRQWLDLVLSPAHIRSEEQQFEKRFGLKYSSPLITVRILDHSLHATLGSSWSEFALPLNELAKAQWPALRVIIVENRVNLQTLPEIPGAIALGGLGNSVVDLFALPWLANAKLCYWGDIDLEGLLILSRLRAHFPQTRSLFMDAATVFQWQKSIGSSGNASDIPVPLNLTPGEQEAYQICLSNNLRIEQERIPQKHVLEGLGAMFCNSLLG